MNEAETRAETHFPAKAADLPRRHSFLIRRAVAAAGPAGRTDF
jgi:hypothetical protein